MNNLTSVTIVSVTIVAADGTTWTAPVTAFTQVTETTPFVPTDFVPTEAQVQAAVDAGIISAYTPVATA
jgi:hypothetical protein